MYIPGWCGIPRLADYQTFAGTSCPILKLWCSRISWPLAIHQIQCVAADFGQHPQAVKAHRLKELHKTTEVCEQARHLRTCELLTNPPALFCHQGGIVSSFPTSIRFSQIWWTTGRLLETCAVLRYCQIAVGSIIPNLSCIVRFGMNMFVQTSKFKPFSSSKVQQARQTFRLEI